MTSFRLEDETKKEEEEEDEGGEDKRVPSRPHPSPRINIVYSTWFRMSNQSFALPLSPEQEEKKKKKKKLMQSDAQGSLNANNLLLKIPSIVELCMISSHEQIETWAGRCKVGINPNFESKHNPEQSRQITLPNGEN